MRFWYCIDDIGDKWPYKGSVAPVKYEDIWNNSDEELNVQPRNANRSNI